MAHKKGQGSVRNGRDSKAKRLGIKTYGGTFVTFFPARKISPLSGTRNPPSMRSVVVFPHPDGPRIEKRTAALGCASVRQ